MKNFKAKYAKIENGELWIREANRDAPWFYVCHENEINPSLFKRPCPLTLTAFNYYSDRLAPHPLVP
ncbi:MAG: hypothetical protein VW879_01930 [Opitutae bacterium]